MGLNKVTRTPAGATRGLFSLLFVLTLSVLQIPTIAFASANPDREGYDMRICLNKTLSTRFSRIGDRFTATVVDVGPFNQAKISGHIEDIKQSGRFKGATEMYLSFDRIRLSSSETYPIGADNTRLYDVHSGEQVDAVGGIETGGRGPQMLKRSGIGALTGGIFGALGGGKGAAIGSVIGGGVGAASTTAIGRKEMVLDQGVEILIRVYRR